MADTIKLFYENAYLKEFDAQVLSCEKDKDGYKVVLDRTAFFPEGGGQYGDVGMLDDASVSDTKEKAGVVYHTTDKALETGATVHGVIDWEVRFERMQQHSGEHIVSGIVHRKFGYDNVGFHLGADYCTMDFNGPITREQLKEIETEANRAVFANVTVHTLYPDKEALEGMSYRSKIEIEGQVRIIEIPGVDVCACCAPHVASTGEIGLIKLVDMTNYKGGERINMLSGIRALADYRSKQDQAKQIGSLLCEKENQIADAVSRLKEEQTRLKLSVTELQRQLLVYKAEETDVSEGVVCVFDAGLSGDSPRELMNMLLERGAGICAVFAGDDASGYRYVIGSRTENVRNVNQMLKEKFSARGGGKPEMVQGSLTGTEKEIKALF